MSFMNSTKRQSVPNKHHQVKKDLVDASEYLGYVTGVWDALEGFAVCTGDKITRGQIGDMVGEYLKNNPGIRDKQASSIIMIYLNAKYPCKK